MKKFGNSVKRLLTLVIMISTLLSVIVGSNVQVYGEKSEITRCGEEVEDIYLN